MRALPAGLQQAIRDRGRELRILVIRFGALGDVLRTLPAVRLIRAGVPEARFGWVVDAGWAPVLRSHPDLDSVLEFPRKRWQALASSPLRWLRLLETLRDWRGQLRAFGPDLAVDFHGNLRSGLTAWLSGAPVRLGYAGHQQKECNRLFSTHRVEAGDRRTPRMERNLDLVRALGLPDAPLPDAGLPVEPRAASEAARVVARAGAGGRHAVVVPSVSLAQAYKKPPPDLLAAAARRLGERGILPLVVWGPGEREEARAVVELAADTARLAPATTLAVLTELLRGATVYVGGDTGPLHLACAVGCPVVALYGPTDPRVNAPWGVAHATVTPPGRSYTGIKRTDRRRGFEGLSVERVLAAVDDVLGRTSPAAAGG